MRLFVLCLCYVFLTPEIENLSPRHIDRTSSSRLRAAFNRCAIRPRSLGPRSTRRSEFHPGMRNWVLASPAGPRSLGPGSTRRSELYSARDSRVWGTKGGPVGTKGGVRGTKGGPGAGGGAGAEGMNKSIKNISLIY